MTLDQLKQSGRKSGQLTVDGRCTAAARSLSGNVHATLFRGARFGAVAKETVMYKELLAVLPVGLPADLEVAAFHAVGAPNTSSLLTHHEAGFHELLYTRGCELLSAELRQLGRKWRETNAGHISKEAALMISDCEYPALAQLGDKSIVLALEQRRTGVDQRTPAAAAAATTGHDFSTLKLHTAKAWDPVMERLLADDNRFRKHKERKGWPAFYSSRDAFMSYTADAAAKEPAVVEDYCGITR